MATKTRVLIVDEYEAMRHGVATFLSAVNRFDVVGEAGSGEECIAMAKRLRPDVVIMDVGLSDMAGDVATKLLVSLLKGVHVIAFSSCDQVEHIVTMLKAGASGCVCKVQGLASLVQAIDEVVAGRSYLPLEIMSRNGTSAEVSVRDALSRQPVNLTSRQLEVLGLLATGKSSKEIASTLNVAVRTVERHREDIRDRTQLKSVAELARFAAELGCVPRS
jgi:DNA-binding NarL/FixJ family response regulator